MEGLPTNIPLLDYAAVAVVASVIIQALIVVYAAFTKRDLSDEGKKTVAAVVVGLAAIYITYSSGQLKGLDWHDAGKVFGVFAFLLTVASTIYDKLMHVANKLTPAISVAKMAGIERRQNPPEQGKKRALDDRLSDALREEVAERILEESPKFVTGKATGAAMEPGRIMADPGATWLGEGDLPKLAEFSPDLLNRLRRIGEDYEPPALSADDLTPAGSPGFNPDVWPPSATVQPRQQEAAKTPGVAVDQLPL